MVRANRCKIIFARRSPMYRSSRRRVYVLRLTFTSPPQQQRVNENKNKEEQRIRREFVLFVSQDTRIDLHAWLIGRKKGGEGGGERRKIENKRRQIRGWRVPENFHSMALRSLVIFFFFFFSHLVLKMAHLRESCNQVESR